MPFSPEAPLSGVGRATAAGRDALVPPQLTAARRLRAATGCCCTSAPSTSPARCGSTASRSARTAAATCRSPSTSPTPSRDGRDTSSSSRVRDLSDTGLARRGQAAADPRRHLVHRRSPASGRPCGWSRSRRVAVRPARCSTPHLAAGELEVRRGAGRRGPGAAGPATASVTVSADGTGVASADGAGRRADASCGSATGLRPWSPEDPYLYDVEVAPRRRPGDAATSGCARSGSGRTPHGRPRLLLNGEPYLHVGVLDQGYWPDGLLHRAVGRGAGARHRDDEAARLHDAAQAHQDRAAAVVPPLRPARACSCGRTWSTAERRYHRRW